MKQLLEMIYGVPATGVHISQVKSTVHTTYPDRKVPASAMHIVIANAIREVHEKLNEH